MYIVYKYAGFMANANQLITSLLALHTLFLHVREISSLPNTTFIDVLQEFRDVSRG